MPAPRAPAGSPRTRNLWIYIIVHIILYVRLYVHYLVYIILYVRILAYILMEWHSLY